MIPLAQADSLGARARGEGEGERAAASRARAAVAVAVAVGGWLIGLWLAFSPTIRSRFAVMQTDWGDTRFNNYVLEHGYRWLLRVPGHESFWNPPFFYPTRNVAAYSDVLLGVAPLYWPWRLVGLAPDTAFQLWTISLVSLNYLGALICCRRLLRVGWPAATLGAFVFAFGSIRLAQIGHQQLLGQCYMLLACYALVRIFGEPADELTRRHAEARRPVWIAVLGASIIAQLYAGYYLGWFLGFALVIGALWALILPTTRPRFLAVVRRSRVALLLTLVGSIVALVPLAVPYLRAEHAVGHRPYWIVTWYLPRVWSWVFLGRESWLYGWMFRYPQFNTIAEGHEHRLGLGFLTTALIVWGLWSARRRPVVQLLMATAVTIVLVCTLWPNGTSAWIYVHRFVPGASAIRGVSRIALVLLIPAAVGLAYWAERMRRYPDILLVAALLVMAEQGSYLTSYDKESGRHRVAVVAAGVAPDCYAFLYTPRDGHEDPWWYHTDAMWASMNTGVPTVNGYTGNVPRQWSFYRNVIATPAHDRAIEIELLKWELNWSFGVKRICRVETPAPD